MLGFLVRAFKVGQRIMEHMTCLLYTSIVGYFIARILSEEKSPFYVNWLNLIGVAFMPISMITGYISGLVFILEGWIAPYPIGIFHTLVFVLVFFVVVIASYIILKKQTK